MISIDQVPVELSKAKGKLDNAKSDLSAFDLNAPVDKVKVFIDCIDGWVLVEHTVLRALLVDEVTKAQTAFDELDNLNTLLNNTLNDALKGK